MARTSRRHHRRGRARRPGRSGRTRRCRQARRHPRTGGREFARRPGLLVARRAVLRRQPRAAPHAHQGQPRTCAAGLAGFGAVRPARGFLAAQGRRSLRRFRRRRDAAVASCAGHALVSGRRLGRARRRLAHGHGNSVPRFHLTWGTGPGVLEPFVRRVREHVAKGLVTLKFRHQASRLIKTEWRGHRRLRRDSGALDASSAASNPAAASSAISRSCGAVIVTSGGIGGDHDLVRKSWPVDRLGPAPKTMVAGVPHHVDGRMIAITRASRRRGDQRRPHVALHRGRQELGADLAQPRHPHPARPVVALVRRARQPAARALPAGLRHARHAEAHPVDRLRLFLVRADPEDHQEGIRAVGLGAEPRPDLEELAGGAEEPPRQGRAAAGRSLQGEGRGFHRPRQSARAGRRHERAHRRRI